MLTIVAPARRLNLGQMLRPHSLLLPNITMNTIILRNREFNWFLVFSNPTVKECRVVQSLMLRDDDSLYSCRHENPTFGRLELDYDKNLSVYHISYNCIFLIFRSQSVTRR
jgi:hypothetical protein